VAVIGSGGAGKSTLARQLGCQLGLPVVHLDERYWRPGWRPTDSASWAMTQERLVAADAWIIDGNYLSTLELRLEAADTVVFLDLPAWRCAWRATLRALTGRGAANTAAGCPERLDRRHLRFLLYIWRFQKHARPRVLQRLSACEHTTTIRRLATPAQVRRFVRGPAP
jgi:adenylate kinase family enzyme